MDWAQWIRDYGYYAVFLGTLLEGETILLLAGFASHRGYLQPAILLPVAIAGAVLGDQVFYYLGRTRGDALLARFPTLAAHAARVQSLIARYHAPVIVLLRFTYGLRIAGPVMVGMSKVAPWRFTLWNSMGAALWAPMIIAAGYLFGNALQWLLGDIRKIEEMVLAIIAVAGLLAWLIAHCRARRHATKNPPPC